MKKLFIAAALLISSLVSVIAQEIPAGPYAATPEFTDGKISRVIAHSPDLSWFSIEVNSTGAMTKMDVYHSDSDRIVPITQNTNQWQKLGQTIVSRFDVIGTEMYVDKVRMEYTGSSMPAYIREYDGSLVTQLLFRGPKAEIIAIPSAHWKGELPHVGEKILIGQTFDHENMFLVTLVAGKGYLVNPKTVSEVTDIMQLSQK
jgi:hypothetical protein